jgi:acyl-CoA hydrolase
VPIIALPATAGAHSRVIATLSGPVSTARCDAGVFVTEYGIADLRGQPVAARRRRMLDIAHPEHRARLEREAGAERQQPATA